ncbi:hypothetical protein [Mammaliicoccus sciuri]|uniref:hypothetical protein n=1 Tax=Mammaliicoccus sciuri TaxID=1296 RepID=UPI0021CE309F|nr:hypothetical protein [Mammaliicoccus sciuri]UXV30012.1 hypothetical protein MUA76_03105 [Mammaliicoccus sciuri]
MAYEYENDVVSALISGGMHYNSNAHYEMAEEVSGVYAKAKAFDEIRKYVNKKLEEEKFPIEDDYLIGRYESYEIIEEIIKENVEDK